MGWRWPIRNLFVMGISGGEGLYPPPRGCPAVTRRHPMPEAQNRRRIAPGGGFQGVMPQSSSVMFALLTTTSQRPISSTRIFLIWSEVSAGAGVAPSEANRLRNSGSASAAITWFKAHAHHRTDAGGAVVQLARVLLGIGRTILDVVDGRGCRHVEHIGLRAGLCRAPAPCGCRALLPGRQWSQSLRRRPR